MTDSLDLRPPQRSIRSMIGVPSTLTISLVDADGAPKEAEAVDLYIGGPTSASWPLPDPLGDVTKITGTLDEETGLWTLALPGRDAGTVLLRLVVDGTLAARLLDHVGSDGSVSPTTELVVREGADLVLHLTAAISSPGGDGTDPVARSAAEAAQETATAAAEDASAALSGLDAKADASSLATVATSGSYDDLTDAPTLALVASTGDYTDLTGRPSLGSAASADAGDFATASQGSKADAAVPSTRKINGLDLTADRTLDAADVGADPEGAAAAAVLELPEPASSESVIVDDSVEGLVRHRRGAHALPVNAFGTVGASSTAEHSLLTGPASLPLTLDTLCRLELTGLARNSSESAVNVTWRIKLGTFTAWQETVSLATGADRTWAISGTFKLVDFVGVRPLGTMLVVVGAPSPVLAPSGHQTGTISSISDPVPIDVTVQFASSHANHAVSMAQASAWLARAL